MHRLLLLVPLALGSASSRPAGTDLPVPPPVVSGGVRTAATPALPGPPGASGSGQRLYGPSGNTLIAPPAVDGVLRGFRRVYASDAAPRIAIYVNRRPIAPASAAIRPPAPAAAGTGAIPPATGTPALEGKSADPTAPHPAPPAAAEPTLADRQTVRDIERLFGRAFRQGGARLTDPEVAAALLPDDGTRLTGEAAAPQRRALDPVADIAVEVLISSRSLTVPEVSGDATYAVPDIQATAIRLKDAAIVGQAAATDVIGQGTPAGRAARRFGIAEIVEATALALMEDMAKGK